MSNVCSLHHIVMATHSRNKSISPQYSEELYKYICGIAKNQKCKVIQIGGIEDHIHILIDVHQDVAISVLMREIKRGSSIWMSQSRSKFPAFIRWGEGYYAFSVSATHKSAVAQYIMNQTEHHRAISPREELIRFLDKNGIEYNPRYIN